MQDMSDMQDGGEGTAPISAFHIHIEIAHCAFDAVFHQDPIIATFVLSMKSHNWKLGKVARLIQPGQPAQMEPSPSPSIYRNHPSQRVNWMNKSNNQAPTAQGQYATKSLRLAPGQIANSHLLQSHFRIAVPP
jgi:hypothetical protein